ncbi:hypothetical protein H4R18_001665 [Coemansia javaensis]|uniref:Uncharacterized protein n=1 Tax=Coemansia javaensis TaxID=2761396 RepID=A0A9W8LJY5_9FUNG|nr:hypothetical protein H4R18_001665 [Coemansia javaensis]
MDVSRTATIGRSHRGLDSMRDLQMMLAQAGEDSGRDAGGDTGGDAGGDAAEDPPGSPPATSDEDEDDIDSETAMNTVYNLLSELGDLNRSNRRAAETLAERFSVLQAQVSRVESMGSSDSLRRRDPPSRPETPIPGQGGGNDGEDHDMRPAAPESPHSEAATFHTPPTTNSNSNNHNNSGPAHASLRLESPVTAAAILASAPPYVPILVGGAAQTAMGAADIDELQRRAAAAAAENRELRADLGRLIGAVRDQQGMAREYEAALAKALVALRAAAFERHLELADVQARYRELLDKEAQLNARLQDENARLKLALASATRAMRSALAEDDEDYEDEDYGALDSASPA